MAELSYNDVQRAVQDGTRDMREQINRLCQQVSRLELIDGQLTVLRREVEAVRRQVVATNTQVVGMNRPVVQNSGLDQRAWQQIGNSMHAIDARLVVMQKYLQDVSNYVLLAQDSNTDEQHFRSA